MANKNVVPEAKEALNRFKMEAANEKGVQLHQTSSKSPYLSQISEAKNRHCRSSITSKPQKSTKKPIHSPKIKHREIPNSRCF